MNKEIIDRIIDPKVFEDIDRLNRDLDKTASKFAILANEAISANESISNSKTIKDYSTNVNKASESMQKMTREAEKARLQEIQLNEARKKAFDDYEKKLQRQIQQAEKRAKQAELAYNREIKRAKTEEKQRAVTAKRITEESRVYNQLDQTLTRLRKDAQDIGAVFGTNSTQFKRAAEQVNNLDQRLKDIDKQLGKSQRFVGEYERAGKRRFDSLGNSINQITRELPAFTFSVQTGFLALSNNLPILFDNIKATADEVKMLREQGEKTPGTFKRLLTSLVSWQTALSLVVTLLTVYGKEVGEFVSTLFKGTEAISKYTQSLNERNRARSVYNNVMKEGAKNAQEELVSLEITRKAVENVNVPLKDRNRIADELQEKYPKYFKNLSNEQILAGNVSNAYKNLKAEILASSLARASQDKIVENMSRVLDNERIIINARRERIKLESDLAKAQALRNVQDEASARAGTQFGSTGSITGAQKVFDIQKKISDTDKIIYNTTTDTNKLNADNLRLYEKINEQTELYGSNIILGAGAEEDKKNTIQSELELEKMRLENLSNINKQVSSNSDINQEDRLASLEKYLQAQEKLFDVERRIALNADGLTNSDRIRIQEEFINKKNQLNVTANEEALVIILDGISQQEKALLQANQRNISLIEAQRDEELANLKFSDDNRISFNKRKQQYDRESFEISRKYTLQLIDEEVRQAQESLRIAKEKGVDTANEEAKLASLKLKYSKEVTDQQIEDAERLADAERNLNEKRQELAMEATNLIFEAFNASFDKRIENIDKELEAMQRNFDFEREQVNESLATEEEKAVKLAQIDSEQAFREQQAEQRKEQIDKKRANMEKARAIIGVGIDQARAQVQALTYLSNPITAPLYPGIAATIAAIGAIQLASILALPAFEEGGEMKKDGLALFGEAGTELRVEPDGKASLTPSTPTIGHVKAGTEFFSNKDLMKMIHLNNLSTLDNGSKNIDLSEISNAISKGTDTTVKAIKKYRQSGGMYITKNGWFYNQRKNQNRDQYIRRNLN